METNVERVVLGDWGEVSLDIRALTLYSGLGKCREIKCWYHTADRYRQELRSWARRINWQSTYTRASVVGPSGNNHLL